MIILWTELHRYSHTCVCAKKNYSTVCWFKNMNVNYFSELFWTMNMQVFQFLTLVRRQCYMYVCAMAHNFMSTYEVVHRNFKLYILGKVATAPHLLKLPFMYLCVPLKWSLIIGYVLYSHKQITITYFVIPWYLSDLVDQQVSDHSRLFILYCKQKTLI